MAEAWPAVRKNYLSVSLDLTTVCLFEGKYESFEVGCFCVSALLILVHLSRRDKVLIKGWLVINC